MDRRVVEDDDDLAGIQDDHQQNEVQVDSSVNQSSYSNEANREGQVTGEDEIDPLDAYMAQIEAEVRETSKQDAALISQKRKTEAYEPEEEDDEDEAKDEKSGGLETLEEIIALAKKTAKRKDLNTVDHSSEKYEPFRKDFYIEPPSIASMTEEEVSQLRAELDGIKIRGKRCPRPIQKWTQCGLDSRLLESIKKAGYSKPTPIQAQAIPAIMSGRDLIGIAKTGSGKTAAFLLPMLRHVLDQRKIGPTEGPMALIMTPTRELAMQVYGECFRFAKPLGLRTVCACGGAPIKEQIADLKRGTEILVCTPGRLHELLVANSGRVTNLRRVTYLVLDEADRMFDLGFGPQVLKVVGNIRPDRQAVLFSATFPRSMEALARKLLQHRPLEIVVGERGVVCDDVEQHVEVLPEDAKFSRLLEILGGWYPEKADRILIFVDKQDAADGLLRDLLRRGYPCLSIHGGKDQSDRDSTIADFKAGVTPILVATSVAARGLDVPGLALVINYECPNHMEDYVHRVGRTGRAGSKGTAFTFITHGQAAYAADIAKALTASGQPITEPLQALVSEWVERVKEGAVPASGSGFGGKGLEHIDQEHERNRKVQKRSVLGEDDISSDEDEGESVVDLTSSVDLKPAPRKDSQPMPKKTAPALLPAQALEAIQRLNSKLTAVPAKPDPIAELNRRYETGTSDASSGPVLGDIIPIYEAAKIGAAPAQSSEERQARSYFCELDINDFPQIVRWRITHKDSVAHLQEYSSASIVIRGEYFPAGKQPEKGQRRLHMRIDAEMYAAVERARTEIRRLLQEYTIEAASKGSIDFSRYEL